MRIASTLSKRRIRFSPRQLPSDLHRPSPSIRTSSVTTVYNSRSRKYTPTTIPSRNRDQTHAMATQDSSKACCTVPPVVSEGYENKGKFVEVDGLNSYVVGPADATKAIVFIYDIFGYVPQTHQGADLLASNGYLVIMPDLFEGKPISKDMYPPKTDEHKAKIGAFFETTASPPKTVDRLQAFAKGVKTAYPTVSKIGVIGFCWGGKIVALSSAEGTPWSAGVQSSPAFIDYKDAEKIVIPMAVLPSKDESAEAVKAFADALKVPNHIETFDTQIHGWMTARADLTDAKVKAEYERGYVTALDFFKSHL